MTHTFAAPPPFHPHTPLQSMFHLNILGPIFVKHFAPDIWPTHTTAHKALGWCRLPSAKLEYLASVFRDSNKMATPFVCWTASSLCWAISYLFVYCILSRCIFPPWSEEQWKYLAVICLWSEIAILSRGWVFWSGVWWVSLNNIVVIRMLKFSCAHHHPSPTHGRLHAFHSNTTFLSQLFKINTVFPPKGYNTTAWCGYNTTIWPFSLSQCGVWKVFSLGQRHSLLLEAKAQDALSSSRGAPRLSREIGFRKHKR